MRALDTAKEEKCVVHPWAWKQLKLTQSDPSGQVAIRIPLQWSRILHKASGPFSPSLGSQSVPHLPSSNSRFFIVTKDQGDRVFHLSPRTKETERISGDSTFSI